MFCEKIGHFFLLFMTYVSIFSVQDHFLAYFLCEEHHIYVVINTHKKMVSRVIFLAIFGHKNACGSEAAAGSSRYARCHILPLAGYMCLSERHFCAQKLQKNSPGDHFFCVCIDYNIDTMFSTQKIGQQIVLNIEH